jgi:hypothetical protein
LWPERALGALINGNPDVYKSTLSRRKDVTLANPFGSVARGRTAVEKRLERAASNYRDGELTGFEQVAKYETPDLRTSWRSSGSRPRSAEGRNYGGSCALFLFDPRVDGVDRTP